jgi:excisionase family DNA binding protein
MTAVTDPPAAKTYDVPAMAGILAVSEKHVRKLAAANKIPGVLRLGGAIRFRKAVVDAWLAEGGVAKEAGRG